MFISPLKFAISKLQNILGSDSKKNLPAMQETGFYLWVRKILWRREWLPTPVFLPAESPWTEAGYSLWGCNELDTTEGLRLLTP